MERKRPAQRPEQAGRAAELHYTAVEAARYDRQNQCIQTELAVEALLMIQAAQEVCAAQCLRRRCRRPPTAAAAAALRTGAAGWGRLRAAARKQHIAVTTLCWGSNFLCRYTV